MWTGNTKTSLWSGYVRFLGSVFHLSAAGLCLSLCPPFRSFACYYRRHTSPEATDRMCAVCHLIHPPRDGVEGKARRVVIVNLYRSTDRPRTAGRPPAQVYLCTGTTSSELRSTPRSRVCRFVCTNATHNRLHSTALSSFVASKLHAVVGSHADTR